MESTHIGGPPSPQYADSSAGLAARFAVLRDPLHDRTRAEPPSRDADGPRYEFGETFARGGLGRIRRAYDRRLRRVVAVKELQEPRRGDSAEARFMREALITARLEHPSIVPIHDVGTHDDGEPYYCMKLVEGRSLDEIVRSTPALADRLGLLPHVLAVADALAYAHDRQVVHRDLKPSNVLVGPFGETVIIDWGLAKDLRATPEAAPVPDTSKTWQGSDGDQSLTQTGELLGTLPYMPLEQAQGHDIGPPADVYAGGALLYFLLSGRPPYDGRNTTGIYHQLLAGPPLDIHQLVPDVSQDLAAIVRRAMARVPTDRYTSARELAEDLRRFLAGRMVAARTYSSVDVLRYFAARHRTVLGIVATSLVLLLALGIFSYVRISREATEAERQRLDAEVNRGLAERQGAEAERATRRTAEVAFAALLSSAREYLFSQRLPEKALPALYEAARLYPDDRSTRMLLGEAMTVTDALLHELTVPSAVHDLRFDPTGQRLLAVDGAGNAHLWRMADGSSEPLPVDPAIHVTSVEFVGESADALLVRTKEGAAVHLEEGVERWRQAGVSGSFRILEGSAFALLVEDADLSQITLANGQKTAMWSAPWPMLAMSVLSDGLTRHGVVLEVEGPHEKSQGGYTQVTYLGWDTMRGEASVLARGFAHNKHSTAVSHDGRFLSLVDSEDRSDWRGYHYLLDLGRLGAPVRLDRCEAAEPSKTVGRDVVFSPDDRRVIRLINRHSLIAWDVATGACIQKASLSGDEFDTIDVSRDGGSIVAIGRNGTLAVFDGGTLTLRRQFSVGPAPIMDTALSPDGSMLAVGDASGRVGVWSLIDPNFVASFPHRGIVLGKDTMLFLGNEGEGTASLNRIELPGAGGPPQVRVLEKKLSVTATDGTRHFLLTVDADNQVSIWSRDTGERLCSDVGLGTGWSSTFVGGDFESVVVAEAVNCFGPRPLPDSRIATIDVASCRLHPPVVVPGLCFAHIIPQLQRSFSPAAMGHARFFDTTTGDLVAQIVPGEDEGIDSFATVFPDGRRIVTGDGVGMIRVLDTESGTEVARLRERGPTFTMGTSARNAAFFSPDREMFITASPDGPLDMWDTTTLENLGQLLGHVRTVEEVEFSDDSTHAVSYSSDGFGDAAVYLWDLDGESGHRLPVEDVRSATFSPGGELLAIGTGDGSVLLWNVDDAGVVGRFRGDDTPVYGLQFFGDWKYLVSGSEDRVTIWKVPYETRPLDEIDAAISSQLKARDALALPAWTARR